VTELINFVIERWPELVEKTLQHLLLTSASTLAAVLIGLPLGIWLTRQDHFRQMVMSVISTLQTIPSLAMLAFLLPFFGIGITPALIALTLYALLPIVRNTITALQGIPSNIIEAADALGFTDQQRLWKVELPLGLPVIIAGIRTATVIGVGIATLAAFIGAGGLGDFIIRGLAVNQTALILLGAIPAALLALLLDFLIQRLENKLQPQNTSAKKSLSIQQWKWLPGALAVLLLIMLFGLTNKPLIAFVLVVKTSLSNLFLVN